MYGAGYFERGEGSNYISYGDDPGWPVTASLLARTLPFPCSMLELGAAKGFFVAAARAAGIHCTGVDVSTHAVGRSRGLVRLCDATGGLPFDDASFDAVVSWEFCEHIAEPEMRALAVEMDRVLRPGGVQVHRIAVCDPGREAEFYSDDTHVLPWTRSQWLELWSNYAPLPLLENALDRAFVDRDWAGRFFAFRKIGVLNGVVSEPRPES